MADKMIFWLFFSLMFVLLVVSCVPTATMQPAPSQPTQTVRMSTSPAAASPVSPSSSPTLMALSATPSPAAIERGEIRQEKIASPALKKDFHFYVYLPAGYETSGLEYPVVYLLHGRGENMLAWARIQKDLDPLIAAGKIPPLIAVMPDFPSQSSAGYYIDSLYTGTNSPGEAVETAFFNDLMPYVEKTFRTIQSRQGRIVGGYSMGGYGAMRYLLVHPQVFFAAIVLSPAVYTPLPPADSSTREFGAFGVGGKKFDEARYTNLNYEAVFPAFTAAALKSYLFIAVGDDEAMNTNPADVEHDLDFEAHKLYNRARRVDFLTSELRVYDGSHTWDVWQKGFVEGMTYLTRYLETPRKR